MTNEDPIQLGGNIELSGFSEMDSATMIIIKKIIGNYAKKLSESIKNFEKITLAVKAVHKNEKTQKFELHVHLFANKKDHMTEITDKNIFFALDKALKKIEAMVIK